MSLHRHLAEQGGSMPVVLLAAIILGGVLGALFITVNTGVDTARRDRDWNAAINVADAGIQEAVSVIRDGDVDTNCADGTCEGELTSGGSYVATYTPTPEGYRVCSVGTYNERQREACADFDENLLFGGAGVVGKDEVRIDGTASSVSSPIIMGTAGEFTNVNNACDAIEEVEVYEPSDEDNPCPDKPITRSTRVFHNVAEFEFTDPDGICYDVDLWESYPDQPPSSDDRDPWTYGEDYCARRVNIPQNDTISLQGNPSDGPVRVFVDPGSTGAAAAKYPGRGEVNTDGKAIDLQFFIRRGEVDLDMKGNTEINAVWYAPDSTCDVRGNVTFTGAILCKRSLLGGSFDFIVPDDIRSLRQGPTNLTRWYEP